MMGATDFKQRQEPSELTKEDMEKIVSRITAMYFSVVSIHELAMDLTEGVKREHWHLLTAINEMSRSCAHDLQECAEKLSGENLGFYEERFGLT